MRNSGKCISTFTASSINRVMFDIVMSHFCCLCLIKIKLNLSIWIGYVWQITVNSVYNHCMHQQCVHLGSTVPAYSIPWEIDQWCLGGHHILCLLICRGRRITLCWKTAANMWIQESHCIWARLHGLCNYSIWLHQFDRIDDSVHNDDHLLKTVARFCLCSN